MVIFHCYVSLPEGKPPFSYGFPMVFLLKPPCFRSCFRPEELVPRQLPVEALEEMIARGDSDADGKVTEDDFYVAGLGGVGRFSKFST